MTNKFGDEESPYDLSTIARREEQRLNPHGRMGGRRYAPQGQCAVENFFFVRELNRILEKRRQKRS